MKQFIKVDLETFEEWLKSREDKLGVGRVSFSNFSKEEVLEYVKKWVDQNGGWTPRLVTYIYDRFKDNFNWPEVQKQYRSELFKPVQKSSDRPQGPTNYR